MTVLDHVPPLTSPDSLLGRTHLSGLRALLGALQAEGGRSVTVTDHLAGDAQPETTIVLVLEAPASPATIEHLAHHLAGGGRALGGGHPRVGPLPRTDRPAAARHLRGRRPPTRRSPGHGPPRRRRGPRPPRRTPPRGRRPGTAARRRSGLSPTGRHRPRPRGRDRRSGRRPGRHRGARHPHRDGLDRRPHQPLDRRRRQRRVRGLGHLRDRGRVESRSGGRAPAPSGERKRPRRRRGDRQRR